jgi:hypothetical protein
MLSNTFVVALVVVASIVHATPTPEGSDFLVNTITADSQWHPDIATFSDGSFVVTWQSWLSPPAWRIVAQRFNPGGAKTGAEFLVSANAGADFEDPSIFGWPDKTFAVAYTRKVTGSYTQSMPIVRLFNANGTPLSAEILCADVLTYYELSPKVVGFPNKDFVVVWPKATNIGGGVMRYTVVGQKFNAAGVRLGALFELSTAVPDYQRSSFVASFPNNNDFVACWQQNKKPMCRRFDGSTTPPTPLGSEFIAPTFETTSSLVVSSIIGRDDGSFVVGWRSTGQDGDGFGVYGQIFSGNGVKVGPELHLSTTTVGSQSDVHLARMPNNQFAAVFTSSPQNMYDVLGQLFDANGNKLGDEFLVTTQSAGYQSEGRVGALGGNKLVTVWWDGSGRDQPPYGDGVFGQLWDIPFATPSPPTPQPTPVPAQCVGSCIQFFCPLGEVITVTVTGVVDTLLWGTSSYTIDSNIGAAAVHAGLLPIGEVGTLSIRCIGTLNTFTGSLQNGVQSQLYESPFAAFQFTEDNSRPVVCYHPFCISGACGVTGSTKTLAVTGTTSGTVYGTDVYSDDSAIGAAAVHAGVLANGVTGVVKVRCVGSRTSLAGSARNGVTTVPWEAWTYNFAFEPTAETLPPLAPSDSCTTCLKGLCSSAGSTHVVTVVGASTTTIWGSDTYSDDSSVAVAAVHSGLVQVGMSATVVAMCQGPQSTFTGTDRNGVSSLSFSEYGGSYTISALPGSTLPPAEECVGTCVKGLCSVAGTTRRVTVTGVATGDAWGVDAYTDDSLVSLAAVHAGLVSVGGTATVVLRCAGPLTTWAGSTRNGVTTQPYSKFWGASFKLSSD